jgi:hypothetical protein
VSTVWRSERLALVSDPLLIARRRWRSRLGEHRKIADTAKNQPPLNEVSEFTPPPLPVLQDARHSTKNSQQTHFHALIRIFLGAT